MRKSRYNFAISPQEGRDRNLHLQTMGVSSRVSRFKLPEPAVIYEDAIVQHGYPYIINDMQHRPLVAPLDSFAAFASAFGQDDGESDPQYDTAQYDETDTSGTYVPEPAPSSAPSPATSAISDIFSNVLKAATPVAQSAVTAAITGATAPSPPPVHQSVPVGATITGPGGTILRQGLAPAKPSAVPAGLIIAAVAGVGLLLAMSGGGGK